MLPQLALQLFRCDELLPHIPAVHFAMTHKGKRRRRQQPLKDLEPEADPVEEHIPKHDREDQAYPFGY